MKLNETDAQPEHEATGGQDQPKPPPQTSGAGSTKKPVGKRSPKSTAKTAAAKPLGPRPGTKQAKLIGLLSRGTGATIEQLAKALDWQKHTVRGAISGALKKTLGLKIVTQKNAAGVLIYCIR